MKLAFSPLTLDKPDYCNRGLFKSERLFVVTQSCVFSHKILNKDPVVHLLFIYFVFMIFLTFVDKFQAVNQIISGRKEVFFYISW